MLIIQTVVYSCKRLSSNKCDAAMLYACVCMCVCMWGGGGRGTLSRALCIVHVKVVCSCMQLSVNAYEIEQIKK